ncbi:hypothetical protein J3Q64DRAFT_1708408 [Phycomyces blakesleeanus]|uniref:Uncharacterized protein n=1 Tax=Phycomyces blakesleeanus TaxID=4837 RepID=A0ABR3BCK6_PHYBL
MRILVWLLLCTFVFADDIYITSPQEDDVYCIGSTLPIIYHVRGSGMANIGRANATLVSDDPPIVLDIPGSESSGEHGVDHLVRWTLPASLSNGPYSLRVAGLATYRCSKNRDGQAPYESCQITLEKSVSLTIINC